MSKHELEQQEQQMNLLPKQNNYCKCTEKFTIFDYLYFVERFQAIRILFLKKCTVTHKCQLPRVSVNAVGREKNTSTRVHMKNPVCTRSP